MRPVVNSIICANFMIPNLPTLWAGRCGRSGPCLKHDVERGLRHPPERGEACAGDDLAQPGLTGLCAERGADLLRQGTRRAKQGREAVVGGADRVEVAGDVVAGEWLDEH